MTEYKLPNAAAHKITVTGTATKLTDLLETAAGESISFPFDLNWIEISPEFGDVRFTTTGDAPTVSQGTLVEDGDTKEIIGPPVDMKLIAVLGSVDVNVRIGWNRSQTTR